MKDGDLELGGYVMGRDWPVFATNLSNSGSKTRDQDQDNPLGDTRIFGRDRQSAPVWAFEFSVAEAAGSLPASGVLESLEALARAWRTALDATIPGQVVPLRYQVGGRVRRVYGRPRNFNFEPSAGIEFGNVIASGEFALKDALSYGDAQTTTELTLRVPPNGYVTLPAVWPLDSVLAGTTRQGVFIMGGSAPAQPDDITFYGPVTDPELESLTGGWKIRWNGTIPYDGFVRIDFRAGTVQNQSGATAPGLSRTTYLPDIVLRPGPQDLNFAGDDLTGTARVAVRWRPAYYAI